MSMPEEPLDAKALFLEAVENYAAEEWPDLLDRACSNDRFLRQEVERLLDAHRRPDTLLNFGLTAANSTEADGLVETTIGNYTLLEELGDGGMGLVYRARQEQPVRREVALKMIKPGMDTRQVIARFEAERQALALMDHPCIARVFDGGAAENGRPYFVMELVGGVPITRFCREQGLSIRERLELFLQVCRAVEHAHQKGIIHRDLKPTNVLVTRVDGVPTPKVIDFGIAKALHEPLTERSFCTVASQLLGTPAYMSPEQVSLNDTAVDTRSDVYSLGVVLYEMLTDHTPHDRGAMKGIDYVALRRLLCETDPPRPSDRVGPALQRAAADQDRQRLAHLRSVAAQLRGELDCIVLRAVEIDRERRYQSVAALASDVQHYLRDEPIEASPPSSYDRFRKLVRRRKGAFAAGAIVLLTMTVGLIVSTWQAIRATTAEQEVEHRLEETARERLLALEAQATAEQRETEVRQLLYASDMTLASEAWRQNDVSRSRRLLARHVPQSGQNDLRGFEWHVLDQQMEVTGRPIAETGGAIYDVEFSPDDRWLAVTGKDAVIRLFDGATFEPRGTIETGQKETNGLAFSRDSARLASAGDDGTVAIWDIATLRELVRFKAHDGMAFQVGFSSDGKLLASCGAGNVVCLWNSTTGAPAATRNKHSAGNIEAIAMWRNGQIVSGGSDGQVVVGAFKKGQAARKLGLADGARVLAVAVSAGHLAWAQIDGKLHLSLNDNIVDYGLRLPDGCQSLAFSRHKTEVWLAVGDRAGGIRILPVNSGLWELEGVRQWSAHAGRVYALAVAPDHRRIVSGGEDGRVMLWEPFPPDPSLAPELLEGWNEWDMFDDGRFAISVGNRLHCCDRDFRILSTLETRAPSRWMFVARDAGLVFYAEGGSTRAVGIWNPLTGARETCWESSDEQASLGAFDVTPDGAHVFVFLPSASGPNRMLHVDVASRKVIQSATVNGWTRAVAPNGRWLAFFQDHEICLYDIEAARVARRWTAVRNGVPRVCFSPDSARLASAASNRAVSIWDHATGALLFEVMAHRQYASEVCFSPDGSRLASYGADRVVRIWDGRSASPLLEWPCTQSEIQRLRFTLDGHRLIGGSSVGPFLLLDGTPKSHTSLPEAH